MSRNRYVYSVAIYHTEEDIVLGEGSGPASHVISNLQRMIEEIRAAEGLGTNAIQQGKAIGQEFFEMVTAGKARSDEWPQYLLEQAAAEIRQQKPGISDEEVMESLRALKATPEFGLAIQAGLSAGQAVEQMSALRDLRRVQEGTADEDQNQPGTRA